MEFNWMIREYQMRGQTENIHVNKSEFRETAKEKASMNECNECLFY